MNFISIFSVFLHPKRKTKVNKATAGKPTSTLGSFIEMAAKDVSMSTVVNYLTAVRSFGRFNNEKDVALSSITADSVKAYERWLREQGVCNNTISCYLRSLRAIYNKGVRWRKVRDAKPFKDVFMGNEQTVKTSLKAGELQRLQALDLPAGSFLAFACDLFLFSF
ncbi:phage integrase SAM-like domain-containing protein [Prevotella intermedia]|uniref:Core-binding (CB) domain-containing protein n=1 Tax=Prevotella intermedia TaxID=28131 RepID=A0A2M8M7S1_PREIN|nr:phage integrase SAM-like domain-containing protein [Prevotella intermedia]PJF00262.1 hypothetical protein CUB97_02670 [Prevotella intermedia]